MRRLLLATTALLALSAAPARAELEVTIGGFTAFQAAVFDKVGASSTNRDFQSETELGISADGKTDNGLEYGAYVQLEASTSDTTNAGETMIYVSGNWGRVDLGDTPGASDLVVYAPTIGAGQINGSYDDYFPTTVLATTPNNRGDHLFTAIDTGYETKVSYTTPKIAGFQAGVSYVPESSMGESVEMTSTSRTDTYEFGLAYEGEYSGVSLAFGGNYILGNSTTAGTEDLNAWSAGLQMGYEGFHFGGGYTHDGDSLAATGVANDNVTAWNVGATYETGPWGFGLSYLLTDYDTNGEAPGVNGGTFSAVMAGASYQLAPGLTLSADAGYIDRNRTGTADDADGYILLTDVKAAF